MNKPNMYEYFGIYSIGINDEKSEKRANVGSFTKNYSLKPWLCIESVHFWCTHVWF